MVKDIVIAVVILGGMGLLFGALLAIASKIFEVKQDERIPLVRSVLPGANCGGCGFPGCDALAEAIVKGEAANNACPVGGADVAKKIAEIMGQESGNTERKIAVLMCGGDCEKAKLRSDYEGLKDCHHAVLAVGGPKGCTYGCMGLGSCEAICPFGAIKLVKNDLPIVDENLCVGCGVCVNNCPKHVLQLISFDQKIHVKCNSKDKGKIVRSLCGVGCIGCKACEKVCENDAIKVMNDLAKIDSGKCIQCDKCVEKCPTGAIIHVLEK